MARMQPELRKQELIEIAFRQFLSQGYEKTSVRSIVKEANGEIGMFYHHFSSKEEIHKAALERFNDEFISKIKQLMFKRNELSFIELLKLILFNLEQALNEYSQMKAGTADVQMLLTIHRNALGKLHLLFYEIIKDYADRGKIIPPDIDLFLLSDFLLHGMSAVIHNRQIKGMDAKNKAIEILLHKLLGIQA